MSASSAQEGVRRLRAARGSVAVFFLLNGVIIATWVTRLPAVQEQLRLSSGQIGLASFGAAVGALVAMNLSGYLAARFGSRGVTTVATLCLCGVLPLLGLANSLPALAAALVLFGASNGAMDVAMNTQGVAVEQGYGRPILNSFHACYSFGGLIGALAGGLVAAARIMLLQHFLVVFVAGVILTIIFSRMLLPQRAGEQKGGVTFARPTRALLALGLVALCALLGEGAISDWSAIYLNGTMRSGEGLAAAGFAAFSVVMALGRGVGDFLTARLGARMMVRLGGLVAALGLTLALVVPWIPSALLGFGLVGAGFSVVFPLTLSAAGRTTKVASGTAIAAVATSGYVGFLVGPPLIGFVADASSLRLALGFVVLLSLCAAGFARAVGDDRKGEEPHVLETSSIGDAPKVIERVNKDADPERI